MSQPWRRFPDAPKTVAKLLEPLAPAVTAGSRVGTRFPSTLTGVMPFIRVTRHGGPSDEVSDYAFVHVDVLSDSLSAAEVLSERIRQKLTTERLRLGSAVVDRVECTSAPEEMPPWAPNINRFEARYTVVFRRQTVPS